MRHIAVPLALGDGIEFVQQPEELVRIVRRVAGDVLRRG